MTKAELMTYVGKEVLIIFKGEREGIYGVLNYADEFSERHDYRKPNCFYIGNLSFKVSYVGRVEEGRCNYGKYKKD